MRARLLVLIVSCVMAAAHGADTSSAPTTKLYDPSATTNALHAALFIRKGPDGKLYGEDHVDPLYWRKTLHLLDEDSHGAAIGALDAFLRDTKAVAQLTPIQRAFLQNDLWRLFNWAAAIDAPRFDWQEHDANLKFRAQAAELMARIGPAIKRLALTENEIDALPDTIATQAAAKDNAGLPAFDDPDSGWVTIGRRDYRPAAPAHLSSFEGRSTFTIYLRLPDGKKQTRDWLAALDAFPHPLTNDKSHRAMTNFTRDDPPWLNDELPLMPHGTKFALVRRLVALDADGVPHATPLAQTVQIRTVTQTPETVHQCPTDQDMLEYVLRRKALFAGRKVTLEPEPPGALDFTFFLPNYEDPFTQPLPKKPDVPKPDTPGTAHPARLPGFRVAGRGAPGTFPPTLYGCFGCHGGAGASAIFTMNSFVQSFSPSPVPFPIRFEEETSTAYQQKLDLADTLSTYERGVLRQWLRDTTPPPK